MAKRMPDVDNRKLDATMKKHCSNSESDRISELPQDVIDKVLSNLTIKEAVRTSILSKNWKEKWHTIPVITVDNPPQTLPELESVIHYILYQHEGAIRKFSAFVDTVDQNLALQAWIYRLRKSCVQDLTLETMMQTAVLPAFEGIIASSPLLEKITAKGLYFDGALKVEVPNLKYFSFEGELTSICFNTPRLAVLSINLDTQRPYCSYTRKMTGNTFSISDLPPALEELHFQWVSNESLTASSGLMQVLASCSSHLKILKLGDACCCEKVYNLQSVSKFWEEEDETSGCSLMNQLRKMSIRACLDRRTCFGKNNPEIKFSQFVLANSPLLEELTIESMTCCTDIEAYVRAQLQPFCKASGKPQIHCIAGADFAPFASTTQFSSHTVWF
ncbi:hypothetical protein RCOM_1464840 [Ricinus communis]|uniref:F-box domain-containing protein n=1 Tax=Ricinus communis TaxID=3988 RepID=B9RLC1_RICCO|nr:hypothetical protein RCOM_1464840 [Ricinus communis]